MPIENVRTIPQPFAEPRFTLANEALALVNDVGILPVAKWFPSLRNNFFTARGLYDSARSQEMRMAESSGIESVLSEILDRLKVDLDDVIALIQRPLTAPADRTNQASDDVGLNAMPALA